MNILVVNCGSSSLGFKVYRVGGEGSGTVIASGKARNVATATRAEPVIEWQIGNLAEKVKIDLPSHRVAAGEVLGILEQGGITINAVGHRFVHGGDAFTSTTMIDAASMEKLREYLPLAPIHNPNSFSAIEVCQEKLPGVPQFAVFDTAFHAYLPVEAREYALPRKLALKHGLRKFGFHGLSCQYVSRKAAEYLGKPLDEVKLILCHLGTGGSSVTAFKDGHSIETSMGYSPLAGLVMSTRCGDIDAEAVLELMRRGYSAEEVSRILNQDSGLIGLSSYSSNLAEVIDAAEGGDERCRVAFEVYANRLRFYLGAYTWLLNGADAIVFTDDIGGTSWKLRQKVCGGVEKLGILVDEAANREVVPGKLALVSAPGSLSRILVIPTDEEQVIFEEVEEKLREAGSL